MPGPLTLSPREARRIAATAPFQPVATAGEALASLGALQLDPISRVERAHRLTTATRLAPPRRPIDTAVLDDGLWQPGPALAFESFVHALCLVPIASWPLWREHHERRGAKLDADARLAPVADRILRLLAETADGAALGELESALESRRTSGWNYTATKSALERLVGAGRVIVSERRGGMRWFDLPERRVPDALLGLELGADEIDDALMARSLRVLGVGTVRDLAKQVRIRPAARATSALARLHEAGRAVPVALEDGTSAWASSSALDAPAAKAVRWVGPFDNFMWDRERIARLFGLDYRLEAYVPPPLRRYGPYALCALVDDRLVGRIDVRADRAAGALEVVRWSPEPGRVPTQRLLASLTHLARRLGLAEVVGADVLASARI